jgi:hypothetical protein
MSGYDEDGSLAPWMIQPTEDLLQNSNYLRGGKDIVPDSNHDRFSGQVFFFNFILFLILVHVYTLYIYERIL